MLLKTNRLMLSAAQQAMNPSAETEQTPEVTTPPMQPEQYPQPEEAVQQEQLDQPNPVDFSNIDQLLSAFDTMKQIGNIVPKCYGISDRTVLKFMNSN